MTPWNPSAFENVSRPFGTVLSFWKNLSSKNKRLLALLLILFAGTLVYVNSLAGTFIWDDEYLIVRNAFIKDGAHFKELFTTDPGANTGKEYGYYRPLFILSYALDYALWGFHTAGYHIVNLILHLAVALLIFFLIQALFEDRLLAWLASLFYVVHPVHVEAVSYISGRVDPLVACGFLTAFLCYVKLSKGSRSKPAFVLMLFSFACALFTKENSLFLPAILLLYHWTFGVKLHRAAFFSLLAVLAGYFIFRGMAFRSIGIGSKLIPGLWDRFPGIFAAVLNYFRLLLVPMNLHMEYGLPRFSWIDPQVLAGLILTLGLVALAFWQRKKRPLVFFSIAWFFIMFIPVSNLYPLGFFMAERYLYLPSFGFFLLLAKGIETGVQNARSRPWVVLGAAGLFFFYSGSVVAQNAYWENPIVFYQRNLQFAPDSVRMTNDLGRIYAALGQNKKALEYYRRAIDLDPGFPYAYNNIGVILLNVRKPAEAVPWFQKALAQMEAYPDAWNNLGNAWLSLGRNDESIKAYEKAVVLLPDFGGYYNNLGNAYKARGDIPQAIKIYQKSIRLNPQDALTHYNLGAAYREQGKLEEAKKSMERAIELRSDFGIAYGQLAFVYQAQGNPEKAKENAKRARELGVLLPNELLEALKK